jgi:type IV pilus assembly protein PilX
MTSSRHTTFVSMQEQRGAILVTSMLFLLVLTVLGVTVMKMSNMQERMAGNTRDVNLALQGAEAALRYGEFTVNPFETPSAPPAAKTFANGCVSSICLPGELPTALDKPALFNWSTAREYRENATQDMTNLAQDPRFVVEEIAFVRDSLGRGQDYIEPGRVFYQVSSHSSGASGQTNVVLQSTFARPR